MEKNRLVEVAATDAAYGGMRMQVQEALEEALRFFGAAGTVSVALVPDEEMRRVNRERRGKDEPTTVLSFAERDVPVGLRNASPVPHLGEILLAPDTISRRGEHIVRFALHGLLHLLGYTHESERDTMEMEQAEQKALNHLEIEM